MHVKALRLAGFKSFATPTILEFVPGVNVIVGPNGSGKSNIADALSWVLGSQAPSNLRGGSMEDVIFAGSDTRARLGIAEVELTLDNSDRQLPLDLPEVSITRSTDRSGSSEYRINGASCRLLDVTELLSDTGIGRSLHAVVGQGQLDAVLQARAEDRRAFIEEAAQIGKHRRRKERSVRKIERVDENLTRLNDVLVELRRAIRPLKRQASAAAVYSELMSEKQELKQKLMAAEIRRLEQDEATADLAGEVHRMSLLTDELEALRAQLHGAGTERERLAERADSARETAHRLARTSDRLASLARVATERTGTLSARLAAETEEGYRERIRLLHADKQRWGNEVVGARDGAARARERASVAKIDLESATATLDRAEIVLAEARLAETAAAEAFVRAEGSESARRSTVSAIEGRVQAAERRRDAVQNDLQVAGAAVEAAEEELRRAEEEMDAVTRAAAEGEARLEAARERAERLRGELGATVAERAAAQARVDAFDEVVRLFSDRAEVAVRLTPLMHAARESLLMAAATQDEAAHITGEADREVEERWGEVGRQDADLRRLDAVVSGAAERLVGSRRKQEARAIELAALDEEIARSRDALGAAERLVVEERSSLPAQRDARDEFTRIRSDAEASVAEARIAVTTATDSAVIAEMDARSAEERALAAQLRLEEAEGGIADAEGALAGLAGRRDALEGARARAERVAFVAADASKRGRDWAAAAEARALLVRDEARAGEQRLTSMRARERELMEKLEALTARRNQAEIAKAESRARTKALAERAMEEWGLSVEGIRAVEPLSVEEQPAAEERADKLERDMRRLGPVNPRAAEEYAELADRERFLEEQIEDLTSSRRDLMKVVHEIDATIVEVFSEAFHDIAREFEGVFGRLFPGGEGRLKLENPDELLTTGVDVEARPPGKNVKKLSLLSGGERALVALAFLFAIFRSRPSPFYLLDEVEAALDDINLHRFLSLIDELEERAQVLIVTHQKRTMEAADVLYGVSIAKDGVSQVVARRMEQIPA
ncbi:MAG: chromosome segregation protein [Actinomycetota bacterium]|nr:chromosome segregation protein [Actinomycetota bacterium]